MLAAETLQNLLRLPPTDRAALALGLLQSLTPADVEQFTAAAWPQELASRLAAVDRGEFAPGEGRDVLERVRRELHEAQG